MKKIIAILIAILMLNIGASATDFSGNKKHKKHHFKLFKHKRRERLKKWNSGHTEFKNRTKKDRRRLSRHHIKPIPEEKNTGKKHVNKVKYSDKGGDKDATAPKADDAVQDAPKDNGGKDAPPKEEQPKDNGDKGKDK